MLHKRLYKALLKALYKKIYNVIKDITNICLELSRLLYYIIFLSLNIRHLIQ